MTSGFFPVPREFGAVVAGWIAELQALGFGPDDPLFPATEVKPGEDRLFRVTGLRRSPWKDAGPIRRIFQRAFDGAGMPYYHPHSVRHTLARHGEKMHLSPEEWQAYSQNFGHSSPMTTFISYGQVPPYRQVEILREIASKPLESAPPAIAVRLDSEQIRQLIAGLRETALEAQ
jgi:integrase